MQSKYFSFKSDVAICERIYPRVKVSLKCEWLQQRLKHVIRKNRKQNSRLNVLHKSNDTLVVTSTSPKVDLPTPQPLRPLCPEPKECPQPKPTPACPKCRTCHTCPVCPICPKPKKCLAYYESYSDKNDKFTHHPSLICDSFFGLFDREVELLLRRAAQESFTYDNLCKTLSMSHYQKKLRAIKASENEREQIQKRIERNRLARVRQYEKKIKNSRLNRQNCKSKFPESIHSCGHICFNNREKICV